MADNKKLLEEEKAKHCITLAALEQEKAALAYCRATADLWFAQYNILATETEVLRRRFLEDRAAMYVLQSDNSKLQQALNHLVRLAMFHFYRGY